MPDTPKKKDLRAADQDTAAEVGFAAGKLPEDDRRKSQPQRPRVPTLGGRPAPAGSTLRNYLIGVAIAVAVMIGIGVCRA